jgi:hypothetical protein
MVAKRTSLMFVLARSTSVEHRLTYLTKALAQLRHVSHGNWCWVYCERPCAFPAATQYGVYMLYHVADVSSIARGCAPMSKF